ncbi:hypothetical protein CL634_06920 [bacterium]|nr:hypothetical protein [bacterium]
MPTPSQTTVRDIPPVTIVIPCHNHAKWLSRAVDSVVQQEYVNKKIIIIDDGSADDSYDEACRLIRQHGDQCQISAIKRTENSGPSAARNAGIQNEWESTLIFGMLDADDTYLPGKISKSVSKIMENPTVIGIVYGDAILENHTNNTKIYEYREPYSRKRLEENCTMSTQNFITKYAFSVCGLYDEDMRTAEDWDLQLRITSKFVGIHIPEPLSTYSITGENASDTVDKKIWQENWEKIRVRHGKEY